MRIISKQRDYYDTVMKHVSDDPNVFVRNKSELKMPVSALSVSLQDKMREFWRNTPSQSKPFELETIMIGFCGKIYPALCVRYEVPHSRFSYETLPETFFTIEQYRKFVDETIKDKKFSEYFYKKRKSKYGWRRWDDSDEYIERYLEKWSGSEIFGDLFFKFKSPIFVLKRERDTFKVSYYNSMEGIFNFHINFPLQKYRFHKVFDPYMAFQELEMYYFGVIGCTEKDTINISDKDMRNQKGFDNMSFKKFPTKRR